MLFEQALKAAEPGVVIEVSPHPVLLPAVQDIAPATGTLRRGEGDLSRLVQALGQAWVHGAPVQWDTVFAGRGAVRVALPTYAFQHQRFWPGPASSPADVTAAGLDAAGHPLLGAVVPLPHTDGVVFTSRLSLHTHPWLADHAVRGAVLLPGTGFVELAVRAGDSVHCDQVDELVLEAPLVLPAQGGVQLQVVVGEPEPDSTRRSVAVYARPDGQEQWTRHASGTISAGAARAGQEFDPVSRAWPAPGATEIDTTEFYEQLAAGGFLAYGPVFRGLVRAWRDGDRILAEVELPEAGRGLAPSFGIHPALLDAALHPAVFAELDAARDGGLPFSFTDVVLRASGAARLRVALRRTGPDQVAIAVADSTGSPVLSVGALTVRPVAATGVTTGTGDGAMLRIQWVDATAAEPSSAEPAEAVVLTASGDPDDVVRSTHELTARILDELRQRLDADDRKVLVTTRGAIAVDPGEAITDPAAAAVWGLVRSAQTENPGRIVLLDTDADDFSLDQVLATDEPQLVLRHGKLLAARLARVTAADELTVPESSPELWRLDSTEKGTLDTLALHPVPELLDPLAPGQVRVHVRAAGLNFRDVLNALGMVDDPRAAGPLGGEIAGEVTEVGPGVTGLAAGDRVMGIVSGGFGPVAVTDQRLLTTVPAGWSYVTAASVPIAFLTAYYGLVDLAGLRAGESVLVHAAAGGVGSAAVQLARHLGAEVYATANPAKWPVLRGHGIAEDRIASSRDLAFRERFRGVDVVLNSLAGEFVDASLDVLAPGGRFLEMGKTDIRSAGDVRPEVTYQAFDLMDAGADRIQEMLREVAALFTAGALRPLPVTAFDVRRGRDAFRHMSQARHTGKIVLTVPQPLDPGGTVVITGGTGGLGGVVARHLAERGARKLLLLSRRGNDAPGAAELVADLAERGARAEIVACDVADRSALAEALAGRTVTGVVHTAGVIEDGTLTSITREQLDRVLAPKVDAAWHLHDLTRDADLAMFVVFSSLAGFLGGGGQGNYAAGNVFLDALMQLRRRAGLPGLSMAWGAWTTDVGLTGTLSEADIARMARSAMPPMPVDQGLALFDRALATGHAVLGLSRLNVPALRIQHDSPMWRTLTGGIPRRAADNTRDGREGLGARLAALPADERRQILTDLVRDTAAAVLGHASGTGISTDQPFTDLGFDSLTSVELRNLLRTRTGVSLAAGAVFDYPTVTRLAAHLAGSFGEPEDTPASAVPALVSVADDPIVIVGMACRFPGGVASPDDLWRLVADGTDGITPFPAGRGWDLDTLLGEGAAGAASATGEGGFLDGAEDFDAAFFRISPREALATDPQQRLLLEVSWEALERAGIDPGTLAGSPTGVFAGAFGSGYGELVARSGEQLQGHLITGAASSAISGRVAYALGLEGPAISVDTACSSSLVAMHLAAQALRAGECTLALAGGVTVMATADAFVGFTAQGGLAANGRCKSFADSADGTGWSEGVGMIVLERLSDAERHGHRVLALLRSSAVNQDGASNGLTAPNGPAQQRVIRQALAAAGLSPTDVDAVEAHGTGTELGDPIEAQALLVTYGQNRAHPLWLGSLKSNIGHAQAAAGVGGVIKMVEALRHGILPKTLHVDQPSTHIDWTEGDVRLLTESMPWPGTGHPRRAGVSSFGVSGTNAHLILEAPAETEAPATEADDHGPVPWILSGKTDDAVRAQTARLAAHVEADPSLRPVDVAWSLLDTRALFDHRAVVVGADRDDLLAGLRNVSPVTAQAAPRLAVLFTGQGAQRIGMARELYESSDVFAAAVDAILAELDPLLGRPLAEVMWGDDPDLINQTGWAQPALFVVEAALFEVLRSHGVTPDYLLGHSIGELTAAYVSGMWSLQDASRVVAARARLMQALPAGGAMATIQMPESEVPGSVSVAAVNTADSVVVSGSQEAVEQLIASATGKVTRLRVSHAFHSGLMDPMLDEFAAVLATVEFREPRIPIVSNLTGEPDDAMQSADYWVRQVRGTVRFADGVRWLAEQGVTTLVEAGPDGVLSGLVDNSVPMLRRKRDDNEALLTALGRLYAQGVAVDWSPVFVDRHARRVDLPTYAFQHQRFWPATATGPADVTAAGLSAAGHPLLGAMLPLPQLDGMVFTSRLSLRTHPWLGDHAVQGKAVFPGTGFVELVVRAGDSVGCGHLDELLLEAPLVLPAQGGVQVQVVVGAGDGGRRSVAVHARPDGEDGWTRHATGTLSAAPDGAGPEFAPLGEAWPGPAAVELDTAGFYERVREGGLLAYGPMFQGLHRAWRDGDRVLAEVELPGPAGAEAFGLHPALLDAALQATVFAELDAVRAGGLPFAFADVALHATGASRLRVVLTPSGADRAAIAVADGAGSPVLSIGALTLRAAAAGSVTAGTGDRALLTVEWPEIALPEAEPVAEWAVANRAAVYADVATGIDDEAQPRAVLLPVSGDPDDVVASAHDLTGWVLAQLQARLEAGTAPLVVVTSGAVAAQPGEDVTDLAAAAVWGLVRSAQTENPGRIVLLDTDTEVDAVLLGRVLAAGEPQLAWRQGRLHTPRLARPARDAELTVPADGVPWRLDSTGRGTLGNLALVPCPELGAPLEPGQVRLDVRAAGLNFRDVLNALGMYPGPAGPLGGEVAGVVTEVGPGVTGLAAGDRVLGLAFGAIGPVAVTDRRLLTPMPRDWSFATAASVPIVFLTAYYGLVDLAAVRHGQSILIHAGAGGVGSAAIQLARHLGARVYATASEAKWPVLEEWGVPRHRIASSRDLTFRERFLTTTDGRGVDVVLNSLAGEFVDASLDVLAPGGRFLEMGKTDVRSADELAPRARYAAFDLMDAGFDRIGEMLHDVMGLFGAGVLHPLPVAAWDVRQAQDAFRHMQQARHVGKLVLTVPHTPDPDGTVVITGGTGGLGGVVARHLAERGARKLLLLSRRGADAPGAAELIADVAERGAEAEIVACDVADRAALADALSGRVVTGVVHTAGVVEDGVLASLDPERLGRVLVPKVDAAWHLHELTREADLAMFVVFSSLAGISGGAGQGNYAAGNVFLDALMQHRRHTGRPGLSMAWGAWTTDIGLTGTLSGADLARLARSAMPPLSAEQGIELFDRALGTGHPLLALTRLNTTALRAQPDLPAVWRALAGGAQRRAADDARSGPGLAGLSGADRRRALTTLVRESAAAVLGHASAAQINPDQPFSDLGFDSLTAVELRNLLQSRTGQALASSAVFDYPTVTRLAGHLAAELGDPDAADEVTVPALVSVADDPIVVVGMACRYPGGVMDADGLWRVVTDEVDGITPFPADRGWDLDALLGADGSGTGTSATAEGGFITGADEFDAPFFRISPREALATDPQQRVLLEVSWEALEQAGIQPASLVGTATGVFAGAYQSGYTDIVGSGNAELRGHLVTGGASSAISGRVAYSLGFEGPAVSIDTACSSSLVAMHLAAQALRSGECTLALAGGVTVMATPAAIVGLTAQGPLAGDGRCKSFSDTADGAGWSEGVGVVVLERLSDARRNGHDVLAIMRSSAVNQDGASNGLTAPNGPSQQRVIRQALAAAGLSPSDVDAVEAHGTGTRLGDPIEAQALLATYGQDRDNPLWLGSLKSNIGHTQAAAGVGGVIKMIQALRHGILPKTLHVTEPSAQVDWTQGDVRLLTAPVPWPANGRPRRAGVSSFGISGTNAHVILESPEPVTPPAPADPQADVPWVLSAKTPDAVRAQAARLLDRITADPGLRAEDVAWSLLHTREAFEHRAALVAGDLDALRAISAGAVAPAQARTADRVVFVFPGQGSQWVGMARDLLGSSPVFAASLRECQEALDPFVDWSLPEMLGDDAALKRVEVVQPVLWAVMVSLAAVWRSFGVEPDAVIGASQGEIAAACVAGELSLADGARVVALRSRLLAERMVGRGVLASVALPVDRVRELLPEGLSIAGINGPATVTVAGAQDAVEDFTARLTEEGVRARVVASSVATHCDLVDHLAGDLAELLRDVEPRAGSVPFHSTVEPGVREPGTLDAGYWFANMRRPVSFEPVARELIAAGPVTFIEISPHPVLLPAIQDIVESSPDSTAAVLGTLRRNEGDLRRLVQALAQAWTYGVGVDWTHAVTGRRVDLPTYPFEHRRYWPEATGGPADVTAAGLDPAEHPLLGAMVALPHSDGVLFTSRLSLRTHPWLGDHAVQGNVVFPGTGYVELAVRAGDSVGCDRLDELVLEAPLVLPAQGGVQVQVVVDAGETQRAVAVYARPDGQDEWTRHASGVLSSGAAVAGAEFEPVSQAWPPAGATEIDLSDFYAASASYGPLFQGLSRAWRLGDRVLAEVELPEGARAAAGFYAIHPALLDAALHPAVFAGVSEGGLPFSFGDVVLRASGAARVRVTMTRTGTDEVAVAVADGSGLPVLSIGSLAVRPLPDGSLTGTADDSAVLTLDWIGIDPAGIPVPEWIVADRATPLGADPVDRPVVLTVAGDPDAVPASTHEVTGWVLDQLQLWLAGDNADPLVVVTRGAVTEPPTDLAAAAVHGLVRSAQTENPGRIVLLDTDAEWDPATLGNVLAADEPQLMLRDGRLHAARLTRSRPTDEPVVTPTGTVLVTGGTGGLGGLVARHLAGAYGIRSLLLLSRRGTDAPGAAELVAELAELGARAEIVACDVTDRAALAAVLDAHPVDGVVHTAGVLDDGVIGSLTREQLDRVLAPKVDAAWHLHELTRDRDLSMFVVFSSLAGILGGGGQGNYAAGNAFLDALVQQRRHEGRPGLSLAWGAWTTEVGRTGELSDADLRRIARSAIPPVSVEQGLALFDRALRAEAPVVALTRLNVRALRAPGGVPAIWRALAGGVLRRAAVAGDADGPAHRLAGLAPADREKALLDLVGDAASAVLGYAPGTRVAGDQPFKELGFDSLTAVELRNVLQTRTGLRLASSAVFDYPTVTRLAAHLAAGFGDALPAATTTAPALVPVADDPIVIVGMACRFPGGVSNPDDLWRLVADEADGVAPFPADRGWDLGRLLGTGATAGTSATGEGGFADGVDEFDAAFFRISPREALATDPQQRLLLEVSWEALEQAGIDPGTLAGSPTGVFAGAYQSGYTDLVARSGEDVQGHMITGAAGSAISGRVAYTLGLEGPAVSVDTACSSSLVSMHLAAQALRAGECSLALAGGVTVMATPDVFVGFTVQGGMAADGRCKSFADSADGAGWAEGAGMVVLERQSDAERHGHEILAIFRSSAVNQDGASNGLTAPNGPSQQRVIRQALAAAGLSPSEVDAVEAHGTGTRLGDPIEAQALLATYGQDRPKNQPLWLGSLKSNIGHTQAAAGVAGVIKMVMALRHGLLPRTLHVDAPTAQVDWTEGDVRLLTAAMPWPANGHPRRAGVSSFGISGTNAHAILEEPPAVPAAPPSSDTESKPWVPWILSGKTDDAVRAQAARLAAHVESHPSLRPVDVAWSLLDARALFDHRAVVVGRDRDDLLAGLRSVVPVTAQAAPRLAVLFTGQGAQRIGMARELYESSDVFAAAVDALLAELELPLAEVMWGDDADLINQTGWAQPALFVIEAALFEVLRAHGVTPDYLLGHSIGEVTAAYVSGMWSLQDASRVVAARARLMQALPVGGAMATIEMPEGEVPDTVSIAAVNTAGSVVVSGPQEAVDALIASATGKVTRLRVSHAFHSALMEPMLAAFAHVLAEVEFREPLIPIVSNLTGAPDDAMQTADYWVQQVRGTVRFADGVRWLAEQGVTTLVEAGPDGVLSGLVDNSVPMLRRNRGDNEALLSALGRLYAQGVAVDWSPVFAERGARRVPLPTYAFQRQRFWPEPAVATASPSLDGEFWATVDSHDAGSLAETLGVDDTLAATMLPALATWRDRHRDDTTVNGWRYRESWKPLRLQPAQATAGRWAVVAAPGRAGDPLTVAVADALGSGTRIVENAGRPQLGSGLTGIVSLVPALDTVTELLAAIPDTGPRLWVLTQGAVSTGAQNPLTAPEQAALWGLGRVAALEQPTRWGGLIDLPPTLDPRTAHALATALTNTTGEDQLAIRPAGTFGRRLVHAPASNGPAPWTTTGTALITGGTGGLGAHVARWIVERGAEHVLLLSRRGPDAEGADLLRLELETAGAQVTVAACDVADRDALAETLAEIPEEYPLRTVVHAAGVAGDPTLLTALTPAELEHQLAPKLTGAHHLDELTRDAELDAFVLFASGAGSWGGGGQGGYAAGNAYLDALAAARRARGRTATSIAWGSWDEGGMLAAAESGQRDHLGLLGLVPMRPDLALAALQRALHDDETTLVVTDIDWARFAPVFTAARPSPLLADLPEAAVALVQPGASGSGEPALRIAGLPAAEREEALLTLVREAAAAVLGHTPDARFDDDQPFKELGFDSLTAVELRNVLQARTGATLAAGAVFDHPDPRSLARALDAALHPATGGPAAEAPPDFFGELYLQAMRSGELGSAQQLMAGGARLRPKFHDSAGSEAALVELSPGQGGPHLILVCPTVMTTGPQVYTRLAEHLGAGRRVSALVPPGFHAGEALPATLDTLVRSLADAVEAGAGDGDLALVGHSSGGVVAYEVAKELQARGRAPRGVVLIDSYSFDGDGGGPEELFRSALNERFVDYLRLMGGGNLSERITAQVWCLELLRGWRPAGLTTPTLYVRPAQPLVTDERPEWRAGVLAAMGQVVEAPGDHFTIIEGEHVATTARIVGDWLLEAPAHYSTEGWGGALRAEE
ncbi:type I polyketide synthase [Symbioplanes lichenis]|uniref:type I polyketide synthase n=1 Tax=Symbioplanes lichenis TaxID=1629072 RepID=UPI0027383060|nr:SDR family NAD(P)-dependent oxidoreductase [Actinoplanes lichenis]